MKTFMRIWLPAKSLGAGIFAGFMCAYVVAGYLYAWLIDRAAFNFTVPFIFVVEGVALAIVIAVLWYLLIDDAAPVRLRFFARLSIFALALAAALVVCVLIFFPFHTDWAKLWWIVIGIVTAGVVALSVIREIYSRITGRRYTEVLKKYQTGLRG